MRIGKVIVKRVICYDIIMIYVNGNDSYGKLVFKILIILVSC